MKNISTFSTALLFSALSFSLSAQYATTITINTNRERQAISPYIYGSNGQSDDRLFNIAARRLGGDRMTSYNWENNFSNGGADYINDNDNYMPYALDVAPSDYLTPNIVLSTFHDTSLAMHCTSVITLPMAGYVARDGNGVVSSSPPSPRWRKVVNRKGSGFLFTPDTSDGNIYVDECMNNLITQFGKSTSTTGIKNYEMDNEWSIWNTSQPLLHPNQPTIAEAISKATSLAAMIKTEMDTGAYVFGPVDFGYSSYLSFQNAPDWSSYSSYGTFANAFMHYMKHASDSLGRRLLDVYDIHYYSSAQGYDHLNNLDEVDNGNSGVYADPGVGTARMEAPRTLWDSSYTENSWIGQFYSPVVYLRALQHGAALYNPGLKLGITEWAYGGDSDISGGIADADMLGTIGRFGVYMASIWGPIYYFRGSAYKIFRNYDGNNSSFGDWHVYANTNNWNTSSVYAAMQSADTTKMNVIVLNKDYDSSLVATVNIAANTTFKKAEVYAFTSADTLIHHVGTINNITGNSFTYTIPKLSAYHFVLSNSVTGINSITPVNLGVLVYPNPSNGLFNIACHSVRSEESLPIITIYNVLGEQVLTETLRSAQSDNIIDLSNEPNGVYFYRVVDKNNNLIGEGKLVIQK